MNQNALQQKKAAVSEISEGLKNSKTLAIVGYQGLTVAELNELRRTLAEKKAHLGVYKNTMAARALHDAGIEGLDEYLEGPNAFVFSEDVSTGVAALYKFSRYHEKLRWHLSPGQSTRLPTKTAKRPPTKPRRIKSWLRNLPTSKSLIRSSR